METNIPVTEIERMDEVTKNARAVIMTATEDYWRGLVTATELEDITKRVVASLVSTVRLTIQTRKETSGEQAFLPPPSREVPGELYTTTQVINGAWNMVPILSSYSATIGTKQFHLYRSDKMEWVVSVIDTSRRVLDSDEKIYTRPTYLRGFINQKITVSDADKLPRGLDSIYWTYETRPTGMPVNAL